MGSVNIDCDMKQELDDSGCVQDDYTTNGYAQVGLLDLCDDVLLYILSHCDANDLKALGFSCPRLGRLVYDRSLWKQVDARSEACSQSRLKWLVENGLREDTQSLMITGYAKLTEGCLGLANITRMEAAEEKRKIDQSRAESQEHSVNEQIHEIPIPIHLERHHARFFISAQTSTQLPRFRGFPPWNDDKEMGRKSPNNCKGPQFTLTQTLLKQLCDNCPNLTTLSLEYCNINCYKTSLTQFPKTLKKLSLRGTKCYNMTLDKSFLYRIQDVLPLIVSLDLSECEWVDPATLLPLSKMMNLEELTLRECIKLAEFVAYASLTARYGFRALKSLDLRGSPVGDSEVSALGWLPRLESLRLAAGRGPRPLRHHAHYVDDEWTTHAQLHDWEIQEPEYFKSKTDPENIVPDPIDRVGIREVVYEAVNTQSSNRPEWESEYSVKRKSDDGSGDSDETNADYNAYKRKRMDRDIIESVDIQNDGCDNSPYCQESLDYDEMNKITCSEYNENEDELDQLLRSDEIKKFLEPAASCSRNIDKPNRSGGKAKVKHNHQKKETTKVKNDAKDKSTDDKNHNNEIEFEIKVTIDKAVQYDPSDTDVTSNVEKTVEVEEKTHEEDHQNPNNSRESENEANDETKKVEYDVSETANDIIAKIKITETVKVNGYDAEDENSADDQNPDENDKEKVDKKINDKTENVQNDIDKDQNPTNNVKNDNDNPENGGGIRDRIVDCIKINQILDAGDLRCTRKNEVIVIASTARPKIGNSSRNADKPVENENQGSGKQNQEPMQVDDANDTQEPIKDDSESKNLKRPNVAINEGASTSKEPKRSDEPKEKYVCFRKNQEPVYVNCEPEQNENRNQNENQNQRREPLPPIQYQIEPRHHVLYVSVGPQMNTYRFPRGSSESDRHLNLNFRHTHVDSSSLVTDFAIRRFGRADGEDVNIIHIGPHGPMVVGHDTGSRPDRSNLRYLSVTGYRNVTDRSLEHLATAAPNLVRIDFSETNITESGAENFRSLRPDCELIFSKFNEKR